MATNKKYLDYEGLGYFLSKLDERFAPIQAIIFKSTVDDIEHLPALNTQKAGYMYNIKTGGITTSDFVEGAGHLVADGENVAAVELYTGVFTPVASPAATDDPKALGWYEVDTVTTYFAPGTPTSDPATEGFYEFTAVTPAGGEDPSGLGWYEASGTNYILSVDTTVDPLKTYATGAASTDPTVDPGKTYYEQKTDTTYKLSQDRLPVTSKTYYTADTEMKWDTLGGLFDLEGRYLEFGDTFPQSPASRMVDGRTFLYMGDDTSIYEHVDAPSGRPNEQGYYEVVFTSVGDLTPYYNPKQQGLYEETSAGSGIYALSEDINVDAGKTYFTAVGTPSTDTTVDAGKEYYTKEEQYKKGGIYEYSTTAEDWVLQSSGGSDMDPITNAEIDELFV